MPPHHKPHYKDRLYAMIVGLIMSSAVSIATAFALQTAGIPITVILPTLAPIWIGITTLTFILLAG